MRRLGLHFLDRLFELLPAGLFEVDEVAVDLGLPDLPGHPRVFFSFEFAAEGGQPGLGGGQVVFDLAPAAFVSGDLGFLFLALLFDGGVLGPSSRMCSRRRESSASAVRISSRSAAILAAALSFRRARLSERDSRFPIFSRRTSRSRALRQTPGLPGSIFPDGGGILFLRPRPGS